jgi:hypothetical protein
MGYSDSDWVGSTADRKSTSGCCFSLGSGMILCTAENKNQLHSVQKKPSIWQPAKQVVKPFDFGRFLPIFLTRTWIPPQFSVIIKAVSSYLKTQSSMIDPSTLKSDIISSRTKYKKGK